MWIDFYKWAAEKNINLLPLAIITIIVVFYELFKSVKKQRASQPQSLCLKCKYKHLQEDEVVTSCSLYKKGYAISIKYPDYCPVELKIINKENSINSDDIEKNDSRK